MNVYSKEFYALEPLIRNYLDKPENDDGGSLNLVLIDGFVDDESIKVCLQVANQNNDSDGIVILNRLIALKMFERIEVVK